LSQRTRSRTTAAALAARKPRPTPANPPASAPTEPQQPQAPKEPATPSAPVPSQPLAPESLARTLRAVAAELERDPALARRVAAALAAPPDQSDQPDQSDAPASGPDASVTDKRDATRESQPKRAARAFTPRLITGASPALGPGVPNPFALHARLGMDGLRAALDELRLGSLRAIAREHGLDPGGKVSRQNDAARLRQLILAAVGPPLAPQGEGAGG